MEIILRHQYWDRIRDEDSNPRTQNFSRLYQYVLLHNFCKFLLNFKISHNSYFTCKSVYKQLYALKPNRQHKRNGCLIISKNDHHTDPPKRFPPLWLQLLGRRLAAQLIMVIFAYLHLVWCELWVISVSNNWVRSIILATQSKKVNS